MSTTRIERDTMGEMEVTRYGNENTDGDNSGNGKACSIGMIMTLTFMVLTCWSLW